MSKVQGTLNKVFERSTKFGNSYSLAVDTGSGEDEWFSAGFDKPNVEEGQIIAFEFTAKTKGNRVYKNVDGPIEVVASAPPAANAVGGSSMQNNERQLSIVVQSSIKAAIDTVGLALGNGAITLGTGKAAAKWDTLVGAIEELARDYADAALNPAEFLAGDDFPKDSDEPEEDWTPVE